MVLEVTVLTINIYVVTMSLLPAPMDLLYALLSKAFLKRYLNVALIITVAVLMLFVVLILLAHLALQEDHRPALPPVDLPQEGLLPVVHHPVVLLQVDNHAVNSTVTLIHNTEHSLMVWLLTTLTVTI